MRLFLYTVFICLVASAATADTFWDGVEGLLELRRTDEAAKLLAKANDAQRNDPLYFHCQSVILLQQAYGVKPGKEGDAEPVDITDPVLAAQAASVLRAGTERYPERLDLRLRLVATLQEIGDFEGQLTALRETLDAGGADGAKWRWHGDGPIPGAWSKMMPEGMIIYERFYFDQNTPEGDARFLQLAALATERFPAHPATWRELTSYYYTKEEFAKALECATKADQAAPGDWMTLVNLVHIHTKLGNPDEARACRKRLRDLDLDKDTHKLIQDLLKNDQ